MSNLAVFFCFCLITKDSLIVLIIQTRHTTNFDQYNCQPLKKPANFKFNDVFLVWQLSKICLKCQLFYLESFYKKFISSKTDLYLATHFRSKYN